MKRGNNLLVFDHSSTTALAAKSPVISKINMYHVKLVAVPGKGEVYVVGGSEDAECTRLSDRVQCIDKAGKVTERKPICSPRAKVGLINGELCSEVNAQFRKSFIFAFGGVDSQNNALKTCEKYNVKANIWQAMPSLNIARRSASGMTIGDSLYVFGGIGAGTTIERLNLKQNMTQRSGDKFEVIDIKLPVAVSDIGILPCISPQEVLLVGGFSSENRSLKQILKFSARPATSSHTSGSQEQVECSIEEVQNEAEAFRADFFNTNALVTIHNSNDQCVLYGAQFRHTFVGGSFTSSQQI